MHTCPRGHAGGAMLVKGADGVNPKPLRGPPPEEGGGGLTPSAPFGLPPDLPGLGHQGALQLTT